MDPRGVAVPNVLAEIRIEGRGGEVVRFCAVKLVQTTDGWLATLVLRDEAPAHAEVINRPVTLNATGESYAGTVVDHIDMNDGTVITLDLANTPLRS
jgi:hypothetical protein